MKKYHMLILILFFGTMAFSEEIEIGSSLKGLSNLINSNTPIRTVNIGIWIENEIYSYKIMENEHLMTSKNYFPFGIFSQSKKAFLIDNDGDSIVDTKTENLFVPYWVIALNSPEKSDAANVLNILDQNYRAFQNDEPPNKSMLIENSIKEIINAGMNAEYNDRDLVYLLYIHDILFAKKEYQICLENIRRLNTTLNTRTDCTSHPVILIYLVETLYQLEEYDEAKNINRSLLEMHPEFVPGLVYEVLLEEDADRKNRLRADLLYGSSEHWLVKEKIEQ